MKAPNAPHFMEGLSARGRLLALLLPILSSCQSPDKQVPEVAPAVSASVLPAVSAPASVSVSASVSAPASAEQPPVYKPVICINGSLDKDQKDKISPRLEKAFDEAGAQTLRVNPDNFISAREGCDAIMAVGGQDLDTTKLPRRAPLHAEAKLISAQRQAFDELFIRWARSNQVPVFGECLGMQELAAWEGKGTRLFQHIPDLAHSLNHRKEHKVRFTKRGLVFGLGELRKVNSHHHQTLRKPLPPTLEVVGKGTDGLIEAVISKDDLAWGIMWHPNNYEDQQVYRNFVDMVRTRKAPK